MARKMPAVSYQRLSLAAAATALLVVICAPALLGKAGDQGDNGAAAKGAAVGEGKIHDPRTEDYAAVGKLYEDNCAVCHGDKMEGATQGVPLVGRKLTHGDSIQELMTSIRDGFPEKGMPNWGATLSNEDIQALAIYIKETGLNLPAANANVSVPLKIPEGVIKSEKGDFTLTVLSDQVSDQPYAMDYLPDGRILVTEKLTGLALIGRDGSRTYVKNTPKLNSTSEEFAGVLGGTGWLLGVAVHPDYKKNGWIYLSYGDVCEDCPVTNTASKLKPTMTRLVRGRIKNGVWTDRQDIYVAKKKHYTQESDQTAGGRIAFDDKGHVYMTVGVKGGYTRAQDLNDPYGKFLRLNDDGSIPADNPFVNRPGAEKAIWAYGSRNAQGLFYDRATGKLWASEHGPRGGDEVNLIKPGLNYGWPLYSLGVNYDGTKVDYGKSIGIEHWKMADIVQPVIDITPSLGPSSLIVYRGDKFPEWKGNIFLATMKGHALVRYELMDDGSNKRELLLRGISRIRDVKQSPEGYIDVLLEHPAGGRLVRLKPVNTGATRSN